MIQNGSWRIGRRSALCDYKDKGEKKTNKADNIKKENHWQPSDSLPILLY